MFAADVADNAREYPIAQKPLLAPLYSHNLFSSYQFIDIHGLVYLRKTDIAATLFFSQA